MSARELKLTEVVEALRLVSTALAVAQMVLERYGLQHLEFENERGDRGTLGQGIATALKAARPINQAAEEAGL